MLKIPPGKILPIKKELERYLLKNNRGYLQWVKPRYFRKVHRADEVTIEELIQAMPVIYQETVNTSGMQFVVIKNDYPWTHQDVSIFALGKTEPKMIFELNQEEGEAFLKLNQKIVRIALKNPKNSEVYCAIGFNPLDNAVGCHTVKRLHSHVCAIDNEYLASRKPIDKENISNWYFLLTFFEPFSQFFYDLVKNYCKSEQATSLNLEYKVKDIIHCRYNNIQIKLRADDFGSLKMFTFLTGLLEYLASEYAELEATLTDYSPDHITERFLPRPVAERKLLLADYLRERMLSIQTKRLLLCLGDKLVKASPRGVNGEINKHSQLWISKGFSGACIFRFKRESDYFQLEFYPKVLSTQALTRGNGSESGASTIKISSTLEEDLYLINKMDNFLKDIQKGLNND